ncbi:hypothetical protein BaRGS_00033498 [Batillaria attramentaria]|uniref:Ig-like domain-containing protein n=1 Tax=Batillaria attramentaria TaxID=370345 RepID=A0ABD0JJT7_9CAEN
MTMSWPPYAGHTLLYVLLFISCSGLTASDVSKLGQPQLSLCLTKDVTFTCDMSQFSTEPYRVDAIQLRKHTGNKREVNLATVSASGVWLASLLTSPDRFSVSGNVEPTNILESRLDVIIADVTDLDFGTYVCTITYTEHSPDTSSLKWTSKEIVVNSKTQNSVEVPGFRLHPQRGLKLHCAYAVSGLSDFAAPYRFTIKPKQKDAVAVWEKGSAVKCSKNVICTSGNYSAAYHFVVAHIMDFSCEDVFQYQCYVETSDRTVKAVEAYFNLEECHGGKHCAETRKNGRPKKNIAQNIVFNWIGFTACIVLSLAVEVHRGCGNM